MVTLIVGIILGVWATLVGQRIAFRLARLLDKLSGPKARTRRTR